MHNELTEVDIQKMKEELAARKAAAPKLREAVKEARALGDLSENDEYRSAKRELGRNNSRIRYLENMIKTAIIVKTDST
ncbi:MAG TPA: transcription elongation factor GreA, partial [Bacillota bacterium]|nr:transcription elongation factor GreA [Bacillota bacterium]